MLGPNALPVVPRVMPADGVRPMLGPPVFPRLMLGPPLRPESDGVDRLMDGVERLMLGVERLMAGERSMLGDERPILGDERPILGVERPMPVDRSIEGVRAVPVEREESGRVMPGDGVREMEDGWRATPGWEGARLTTPPESREIDGEPVDRGVADEGDERSSLNKEGERVALGFRLMELVFGREMEEASRDTDGERPL